MQKPKMLVGQAGVRYGLQTRQPKPAGQPAGKLAAFGADSDSEEETVGAQVARQAARKVADSKVFRCIALSDNAHESIIDLTWPTSCATCVLLCCTGAGDVCSGTG